MTYLCINAVHSSINVGVVLNAISCSHMANSIIGVSISAGV